MHLLHSEQESSHTHSIIVKRGATLANHDLLSSVIYRIELSYFVGKPDSLKEDSYLTSSPWNLEVILGDSHLCIGRREKKVHCLWLVPIVVVVSNRPLLFEGDVRPYSGTPESPVCILWPPHLVPATRSNTSTEISVRL